MTETTRRLPTRVAVIGDQAYDKPYDQACGACRSPYGVYLDAALAEGHAYATVRRMFAGRKPACPTESILATHVRGGHLAEPHMRARITLEEAAAARGADISVDSARGEDAIALLLRQGTGLLATGMMEIRASDVVAAARLQAQLEKTRDGEGAAASQWQQAFMAFFEIVRRTLTHEQWKAFVTDVYASPEIQAVMADQHERALPGGTI